MNEKLNSAKNFVVRNKTKILVTALVVTTTVAVIEQTGIRSLNAFLKENNLYDTYYRLED
jgi:CHASE2 domain-containing sensor protein